MSAAETNVSSAWFCLEIPQGHPKLIGLLMAQSMDWFLGENRKTGNQSDFPMIFSWGLNRFHFSPTNQSIDSGNLRKRVLRLCGTGCLASLCRSTPENLIRHCPFAAGFGRFWLVLVQQRLTLDIAPAEFCVGFHYYFQHNIKYINTLSLP